MSEAPSVRESIEAALSAGSAPDAGATPGLPDSPAPVPLAPAPAPLPAPAEAPAPAESQAVPSSPGGGEPPAPKKQPDLFAQPEKFNAPKKPAAAPAPAAPAAPELKAPASWRADLRERWKALPPEVQGEIVRRERENDGRMQEAAQLRRFAQKFTEIAEPYRAIMEAEGTDPMRAFHDYLRSATLLRTGSPADKAAMVARLVTHFGVPVQMLDQYLEQAIRGGVVAQPQQQMAPQSLGQQPQQFRDPRVDQLLAERAQQSRAAVVSEAQAFAADPKNEFFEDVRLTMADVMDAAAKRGITMSMADAYERACQIEPEVRKVLQARNATTNASQAARTLAAARHAASSLPSAGAPPAPKANGQAKPGSVRDAILQSIDTLTTGA